MTKQNWVMFGRQGCEYCVMANDLLKRNGQDVKYFDVRQEPVLKEFMELSGMPMTVPQLFLNGHWMGGYEDLHSYLAGKTVIMGRNSNQ